VDAFWQAGIDAGFRDDGAPGPRAIYGPDYYGGFLLDPDGNSAEAVHGERSSPVPPGRVDHLWIRVADLEASKRFYATIAPHAGIRLDDDDPARVRFAGGDYSFSLIDDERPLTEHVHLAFPAGDDATVRAFHAAALAGGYEDHRRARRAPRVPPGLLRRVRPRPRRAQRRGRQPQSLSHGRRRRTPHLPRPRHRQAARRRTRRATARSLMRRAGRLARRCGQLRRGNLRRAC
jgi:catechol 2,3-dioxygenase-like lactoylglutathione lyase family enzyme